MNSPQSASKDNLSLLLPYYLDKTFSEIFRHIGFEVFWADNRADTERIIMEKEPDLAIEWRYGEDDFPIRDLLRKYGRPTPVFLALNWRGPLPDDPGEIGCMGYIDVPFKMVELMDVFNNALPERKRHLLKKIVDDSGVKRALLTKETIISEEESLSLSERLNALRQQVGEIPETFFPDESVKGPFYFECPRFDVNRFLDAFDRIKLNDEYVLDYFYEADELGGSPIPFTRKGTSDPIALLRELSRQKIENKPFLGYPNMIRHIEFEKSALGYFQFAVFKVVVHQFYLFWHAGYNDLEFILSKLQLDELLSNIPENKEAASFHDKRSIVNVSFKNTISREERSILNKIALNPRVKMHDDSAIVTMVAFTKWGGFYYDHTYIKWPNAIEKKERDIIVQYDCGVMF